MMPDRGARRISGYAATRPVPEGRCRGPAAVAAARRRRHRQGGANLGVLVRGRGAMGRGWWGGRGLPTNGRPEESGREAGFAYDDQAKPAAPPSQLRGPLLEPLAAGDRGARRGGLARGGLVGARRRSLGWRSEGGGTAKRGRWQRSGRGRLWRRRRRHGAFASNAASARAAGRAAAIVWGRWARHPVLRPEELCSGERESETQTDSPRGLNCAQGLPLPVYPCHAVRL
mmetsp:Transcript_79012/g.256176  ORF Transcript_79012/g.256176 Transcript_79012/m.256176 type:complete len:229 (-) Transcript_79012:1759-2445(-)